ncbi:HAD family hydrolase [Novosphingobium kaempferiae]|uniref:HAD family hydrolase n=1 Tax=Novosphingobium kaempferiae TaxID=2896849 RepID=UPI001E427E7C|nr:HAD family phosphatase [Novosphingobium kaempferiae]
MAMFPPTALPDPIRAVIFDMDGTLIDTESVHHRAYEQTGKDIGWPLPREVLDAMVGINRDANAVMLAERMGPDFPLARFYDEADALFDATLAAGLSLRPGAPLILEHFRTSGIPMAIATSTVAPFAQQRLEQAGLLHYFDVIVTRSDVTHPKPHPEPYLLAASRLGVDIADCIAVEDSYAGVRSATSAGLATVMVPDLLPPDEEMTRLVSAVLPSLSDLRDLLLAPAEG